MYTRSPFLASIALIVVAAAPVPAAAATSLRVMPPEGTTVAVGQRFDLRVEASAPAGSAAPAGLRVMLDGVDITDRNTLDAGSNGERGYGGTGAAATDLPISHRAGQAPPHTSNFLVRDLAFDTPGDRIVEVRTADGATARVTLQVVAWDAPRRGRARARNIIFLVGDGMGIAHRTAARIVGRGLVNGKARRPLAMDTLEVSGTVSTSALNAVITDSAPGMSSYVTGAKSNNNQEGVFPDNTLDDPFDNPKVEYLGEFLRRLRGRGFNVGIVTTGDVTDATPGANAVHTADRLASDGIAARFFDERDRNGVTVLMGGGSSHFVADGSRGARTDGRDLGAEFTAAGFTRVDTAPALAALSAGAPPRRLLGLFSPGTMPVAFDKVGAGRYSDELAREANAARRDAPMLRDMAAAALRTLEAHSPAGFYLMVEAASIDKAAHNADAERAIWDTLELDGAVEVALAFAARTNSDADATNDTLVIVTADHECGGLALIGVGNERYAPQSLGRAVRDYAAVFRFEPEQRLDFTTNYEIGPDGYPVNPDPSRKLLLGWAAAPDRYENWLSNRYYRSATAITRKVENDVSRPIAVANPQRDSGLPQADNKSVSGEAIPGFLVEGVIENGEYACAPQEQCGDTSSLALNTSGHTATDVVLSASGPGALQFTGAHENTAIFFWMLRATTGSYPNTIEELRASRAR